MANRTTQDSIVIVVFVWLIAIKTPRSCGGSSDVGYIVVGEHKMLRQISSRCSSQSLHHIANLQTVQCI